MSDQGLNHPVSSSPDSSAHEEPASSANPASTVMRSSPAAVIGGAAQDEESLSNVSPGSPTLQTDTVKASEGGEAARASQTSGIGDRLASTQPQRGSLISEAPQIFSSGLRWTQKARLPLASFGYMVVFSSMLAQPVVYISVFGTNPGVVGVINIVITIYDMINTPIFGQMSDEGRFNRWCFKDIRVWGRRAPLALCSLPLSAAGFYFHWVGPESLNRNQVALGLWLLMVRFLLTTGMGGMFWVSNDAAFSELFPNNEERASMSTWKGLASAAGIVIGGGAITTAAIAMEDEAGSAKQKGVYQCIGIISLLCIVIKIPWCLLMKKSVMTEANERQSLWSLTKSVWYTGNSVRVLSLSFLLFSASASVTIPLLTFFLMQNMKWNSKETALGQTAIVGMFACFFLAGFPVAGCLNKRYHPASVIFYVGVVSDVVAVVCVVLALVDTSNVGFGMLLLAVGMGQKGFNAAVVTHGRQILTCMIVDEDHVVRSGLARAAATTEAAVTEVRRDGIFAAFVLTAMAMGRLVAGFNQIVMGAIGYDPDRDRDNILQPEAVKSFLWVMVLVVGPLVSCMHYTVLYLYFPLVGERLRRVNAEYAALFSVKCILKTDALPEGLTQRSGRNTVIEKSTRRLSHQMEVQHVHTFEDEKGNSPSNKGNVSSQASATEPVMNLPGTNP